MLYNHLDTYRLDRLNQAYRDAKQKTFQQLKDKITEIIEICFPHSSCLAEFLRIRTAEGCSPQAQYNFVSNQALDCGLETLTAEKIRIMIMVNSVDKSNARLSEKTLEMAASTKLIHELFLKLLSDHEI